VKGGSGHDDLSWQVPVLHKTLLNNFVICNREI
jgi:hypothetical protein